MAKSGQSNAFKIHPDFTALRMFLAPNGKSENWYAGFYHGGKYIRQSMKTSSYEAAVKAAGVWYEDRRYEIRNGIYVPPSGTSFAKLVQPTLDAMATRKKAARYVETTEDYLSKRSYVGRFFGPLAIEKITTRTWDEFRQWLTTTRIEEKKPLHSERSIHQMKNAVSLVLRQAYVEKVIDTRPRFEDSYREAKRDSRPRTQFGWEEKMGLRSAIVRNIHYHREKKTRWVADAEELRDYVNFMMATGLRVGESRALRVRDIELIEDDFSLNGEPMRLEICLITIVGGKRGAHPPCKSHLDAAGAFRSIVARRGIDDPSQCDEPLFLKHHRDMFRKILSDNGLYKDAYGRRRDFVSLRHTYICDRLADQVPVFDVARNTRTSIGMIENHYARNMPLAGLVINGSVAPPKWSPP